MKALLRMLLAASLALSGPASAAQRETSVPARLPSMPPPLLAPSAALPSLAVTPKAFETAHLAAPALPTAAVPPPAAAGLTQTATAIAQEQAQPGASAAEPSAAALKAFDGAAPAAQTPAVSGAESAVHPPALLPHRWSQRAEASLVVVPAAFLGGMAHAFTNGTWALPAAMAGLSLFAAAGIQELLAESRKTVVGGWQASHDQKFRIDPATGQLKDVRGKKYGEDRYEEYEKGPVTAGERLYARLLGAGLGAAWLLAHPPRMAAVFAVLLAAGYAVQELRRRRAEAQPKPIRTAEELAHARRFLTKD